MLLSHKKLGKYPENNKERQLLDALRRLSVQMYWILSHTSHIISSQKASWSLIALKSAYHLGFNWKFLLTKEHGHDVWGNEKLGGERERRPDGSCHKLENTLLSPIPQLRQLARSRWNAHGNFPHAEPHVVLLSQRKNVWPSCIWPKTEL